MPPVVRAPGDIASGHGSFPPTTTISGASQTYVNGLAVHRQGDPIVSHGSPSPSPVHSRAAAGCSSDSFVEGKGIVRIGDAVNCGGVLVTGSGDVFCN